MDSSTIMTRDYKEKIMSHYCTDETIVNGSIVDIGGFCGQMAVDSDDRINRRRVIHSEPTVELNHPIESGILPNVDDFLDSETEEVVFPFNIESPLDGDS